MVSIHYTHSDSCEDGNGRRRGWRYNPRVNFEGEFETHLTVACTPGHDTSALRAWGAARGLKCTHIVLARGTSASQPMLTRQGRGNLPGELAEANAIAAELSTAGFEVTRIKIEASPFNRDVPRDDDADGAAQSPDCYFEHHVKLLLDSPADIDRVTAIARDHAAHVSRNALRTRNDGREERFVTQRCFRVGRDTANRRMQRLVDALRTGGYHVLESEAEFVVYDGNRSLDNGWLDDEERGTRP